MFFSTERCFVIILSISGWVCAAAEDISLLQSFIDINPDGSVAAKTKLPSCQSGKVIQIMKLASRKKVCNSICLNIASNKHSPEIEDRLHEMCSLKERCTNTSFPLDIIQREQITGINVSYNCIDSTTNFVRICETKALFFTSDTHLIGTGKTEYFKECRCFINGGTFMISLTDLRLQSKSGRNCSSTALQINSKSYDCNKPGYEDTFGTTVEDSVSKAFVSITPATDSSTPKMIWLRLRPKDTVPCSVECIGIPRYDNSETTSILQSSNTTDLSLLGRYSAISYQEMSPDSKVAVIVGSSVSVVIAVVAVGIAIYCIVIRSKWKCKHQQQGSPKNNSVRSQEWETEETDPCLNGGINKVNNGGDIEKQEGVENTRLSTPRK